MPRATRRRPRLEWRREFPRRATVPPMRVAQALSHSLCAARIDRSFAMMVSVYRSRHVAASVESCRRWKSVDRAQTGRTHCNCRTAIRSAKAAPGMASASMRGEAVTRSEHARIRSRLQRTTSIRVEKGRHRPTDARFVVTDARSISTAQCVIPDTCLASRVKWLACHRLRRGKPPDRRVWGVALRLPR